MDDVAVDIAAWAASGAMFLTGPADGPPSPVPAPLATAMAAAAHDLGVQTARWGTAVDVDGPALLGERAAITGMTRAGSTSVGGSARFARVADGWVALNLPRPEDVAALPALVERAVEPGDWPAINAAMASMSTDLVVERAALLGLAIGAVGNTSAPGSPGRELARGGPRTVTNRPLVVDMGSLWAGPLTGQLLADAGARVIKVEGRGRPDGGRAGATVFFDLLNSGKECASVDLSDRADVDFLRRLLAAADLVIEASRPRAMDQIGIDPVALTANGACWLSITGHGRIGAAGRRVGFGDDAAAEGGLVVAGDTVAGAGAGDAPMFVADAVADPLTGLIAAALGAELLAESTAAVIEVPLSGAAAWVRRPPVHAPVEREGKDWLVISDGSRLPVVPPRHRSLRSPARRVGADDAPLRLEFGG
jgi:hypothetical protein